MRIRLSVALFFLLFSMQSFSQVTAKNDTGLDFTQQEMKFSALIFSFDYASNTGLLGSFNAETKQPSYSPAIVFFSKWGIDVSAMGFIVDNSDDSLDGFTSELDLSAGYSFELLKDLTIAPAYSHYFYSDGSNSLKSIFSDNFNLDVNYQYRFAGLGASAGFYTGKQHTFYMLVRNNYLINFENVLLRNLYISIQPGIDAGFGDYEYLNLYYLDQLRENPDYLANLTKYRGVRRYIYFEKRKHPELTAQQIMDNFLESKVQDNFKLTSVSFSLPVTLIIGNVGLNLGMFTYFPFGQPEFMSDDVQFFFNAGISYILPVK